jgi:membrane-bound serine protease (ClpP class)
MNTILLLFSAGVVLLAFEVFVPGAVLGILGTLAILGGCAMAFYAFGPSGGMVATLVAFALLGAMLYIEFVWLPKTRVGGKLFLRRSVNATSQPPVADANSVVGRGGVAATTLAPSGYVVVDGRRYEAFSQSGLIARDAPISVVGVDNFRLIVSQPKAP